MRAGVSQLPLLRAVVEVVMTAGEEIQQRLIPAKNFVLFIPPMRCYGGEARLPHVVAQARYAEMRDVPRNIGVAPPRTTNVSLQGIEIGHAHVQHTAGPEQPPRE